MRFLKKLASSPVPKDERAATSLNEAKHFYKKWQNSTPGYVVLKASEEVLIDAANTVSGNKDRYRAFLTSSISAQKEAGLEEIWLVFPRNAGFLIWFEREAICWNYFTDKGDTWGVWEAAKMTTEGVYPSMSFSGGQEEYNSMVRVSIYVLGVVSYYLLGGPVELRKELEKPTRKERRQAHHKGEKAPPTVGYAYMSLSTKASHGEGGSAPGHKVKRHWVRRHPRLLGPEKVVFVKAHERGDCSLGWAAPKVTKIIP